MSIGWAEEKCVFFFSEVNEDISKMGKFTVSSKNKRLHIPHDAWVHGTLHSSTKILMDLECFQLWICLTSIIIPLIKNKRKYEICNSGVSEFLHKAQLHNTTINSFSQLYAA